MPEKELYKVFMTSKTISIDLGDKSYPILIGEDVLNGLKSQLAPYSSVILVTDKTVAGIHLEHIQALLPNLTKIITLPAGESTKGFQHFEYLCNEILSAEIERKSCLIALGGGVIGDITGFAASVIMRGIAFVQIPTTLLSQIDSSVGGKTAINSPIGKNLIGTFYQPKSVFIDVNTLKTLPKRQILAGYAEMLKAALVYDRAFFNWLLKHGQNVIDLEKDALVEGISRSCAIKAEIVSKDETEKNLRMLLNLGHTFGHAIESINGYKSNILHGEAVSVGMVMALRLSTHMGNITPTNFNTCLEHMRSVGLPCSLSDLEGFSTSADHIWQHMQKDKKRVDQKITLILLKEIGTGYTTQDAEESDILQAIKQSF